MPWYEWILSPKPPKKESGQSHKVKTEKDANFPGSRENGGGKGKEECREKYWVS